MQQTSKRKHKEGKRTSAFYQHKEIKICRKESSEVAKSGKPGDIKDAEAELLSAESPPAPPHRDSR